MFDKLIEVLLDFLGWFQFWVIIGPADVGVVYTLGRDTSYITSKNGWFGTGFHLLAPFDLEGVLTANIQWDWDAISYQSLETKDGKLLIVQIAYKYRLQDNEDKIRRFLVCLNDERNTRRMAIGSAVCSVVADSTHEELKKGETEVEVREADEDDESSEPKYVGIKKQIFDGSRAELTYWGYRIAKIEWLQRTRSRTFRIMNDGAAIQQTPIDEEE